MKAQEQMGILNRQRIIQQVCGALLIFELRTAVFHDVVPLVTKNNPGVFCSLDSLRLS
jgi:hypothetical protein